MTLPFDKLNELQLMLDMTYEGDTVGISLLCESLTELAECAQGEPLRRELLDLASSPAADDYLVRVRIVLEREMALSTDSSGSIANVPSPTAELPAELLNEIRLIVEMTHQGDTVGYMLIAEQFSELRSFAHGHPAEHLIAELAESADAPNYLEVVQFFLEHRSDYCPLSEEDGPLIGQGSGVKAMPRSTQPSLYAELSPDADLHGDCATGLITGNISSEDLGDIAVEYTVEGDLEILQEFCTECEEHINAIEQVILGSGGSYDKDAIDTIFRGIHSIKGGSAYFNLQEMTKCSHLLEDMLHEVREGHRQMNSRLEQLCLFYLDCQKDALKRYREASASGLPVKRSPDSLRLLNTIRSFDAQSTAIWEKVPTSNGQQKKNGEVPFGRTPPAEKNSSDPSNRGDTPYRGGETVENEGPRISAAPIRNGSATLAHEPAAGDQKSDAPQSKKSGSDSADAGKKFVKVATERLDNLIDLIGEMVVFSSVLVRHCKLHMSDQKDAMDAAHRVEKFSRELQDVGISMRLDPIRGLFQKMQRLVWDTSKRLGKSITFQMEGEETELDRNLIDRLADPLMHMVRNSLDHGIEPADERRENGKPTEGTIKLSAFHSGGNVHIKIEDDGRGLNSRKLISKAVEKGLIEEGKRLSEEEAFQLIFSPGFSTAEEVTDLSGRGVGMDVVRRNVEDLRGRIHIQSTIGKGSSFIIELPLTLAIIDGIQIMVGSESFIIPSLSIVEFLRPKPGLICRAMDSAETFFFRGRYLPLFRLSDIYHIQDAIESPERASIVILEDNGEQYGFLVDSIEGECSTVIKNLGGVFEDIRGISGGAIMPQGNVVLILDVKSLIRFAQDSYSHARRVPLIGFNNDSLAILH